jgi:glycolate oxidase iron-sulfur subunit
LITEIDQLQEMAEKCVRCGICQSVCPVFTEVRQEGAVARGKITLVRKLLGGDIAYSPKLSTYLLQCLGCGACSENCPNGVKGDELILATRALLVEKKGLSFPKWLFFRVILNSVNLLPFLLKTGSLLQGLLLRKIPRESGLHLRFSLPYLDRDRWMPSLTTPFFLNRFPNEVEGRETGRKIGLFSGCSINYLFPSIGEATVRLLRRTGFSVVIPRDQTCCGLPAYGSGDIETAKSLALRNIKAFGLALDEPILVPCGSCFYFLKEGYAKLFPGDETVTAFTRRLVEPATFFTNFVDLSQYLNRPSAPARTLRVTYHDPCHLRRGMKIFKEPRTLLRSLPGIDFVEMKKPDRCCGMAGSFNFIYYDLSKKILKPKLDDIEATKADAVVTSCMGCLIQLQDGVHQRAMGKRVIHLMDILEEALALHKTGTT